MLTWKILWSSRKRGLIMPVIRDDTKVEDLRITEIIHRQKEIMDEMDKLDEEIKSNVQPEYYTGQLYNADPNCQHILDEKHWGGIKCFKCGGWFCY